MRSTLPKLKKSYESKCKEGDSSQEELDESVIFLFFYLYYLIILISFNSIF